VDLSLARIEQAARSIDPIFLRSPQYEDQLLNDAVGRRAS
jgi:hypothetical protein